MSIDWVWHKHYQSRYRHISGCSKFISHCLVSLLVLAVTGYSAWAYGDYVSNDSCPVCHADIFQQWESSHHAKAMGHASRNTVLGDFNNTIFQYYDIKSRFYKKADGFYVKTDGPDGKLTEFEVKYVFGVEPLQQYLIELPGGRLQALSIAWDTVQKSWFHLYPKEKITAGDPLHWTNTYQNWNMMCGDCHTTNYRKNYNLNTRKYKTTYSAINVSCQACHGPASQHMAWATSNSTQAKKVKTKNNGFSIKLSTQTHEQQVGLCAQCHSRRTPIVDEFEHGMPFLDQFNPALLRPELYHVDGQILDEVYVYGSFLQSKMYQAGVRCTNCHNPHTGNLKFNGNALCTQCHTPSGNPNFPSLTKANYDAPSHHHHIQKGEGAQCVNCHMPAKNYMLIDRRHDHSFRIPRPDLSKKLGVPNTCNQCHKQRSSDWATNELKKWGVKSLGIPSHAEALQGLRDGHTHTQQQILNYIQDEKNASIHRATALTALNAQSREGGTAIVQSAFDSDPIVRASSLDQAEGLPDGLRVQTAYRALTDDSRLVRLQAAKALADVPLYELNDSRRQSLSAAFDEYLQAQAVMADSPGGQFNLAVFYQRQRDAHGAEQHYRETLLLDSSFLPARFNLANLLNSLNRNSEAEKILRDGLHWAPNNGDLHYSLGLLLAEEKQYLSAASSLQLALAQAPENPRVYYNYALVLQQLDQWSDAEKTLERAYEKFPQNLDIANGLLHLNLHTKDWKSAKRYLDVLLAVYPNDPNLTSYQKLIIKNIRDR